LALSGVSYLNQFVLDCGSGTLTWVICGPGLWLNQFYCITYTPRGPKIYLLYILYWVCPIYIYTRKWRAQFFEGWSGIFIQNSWPKLMVADGVALACILQQSALPKSVFWPLALWILAAGRDWASQRNRDGNGVYRGL